MYSVAGGTAPNTTAVITLTVGSGLTGAQGVAVGDVVFVGWGTNAGGTQTVSSVTDSQGHTYARQVQQATGGGGEFSELWTTKATHALVVGTDTITITASSVSGVKLAVVRASSGITSATADKVVANQGTTGNPSAGPTATLSSANEVVIAGINNASAGGIPSALSWGGAGVNISSNGHLTLFDETVTSNAAVTAGGTVTSGAWTCWVATFARSVAALTVTSTSPPAGTVGSAYGPGGAGYALTSTGGSGAVSWNTTGALPPGLKMSGTGTHVAGATLAGSGGHTAITNLYSTYWSNLGLATANNKKIYFAPAGTFPTNSSLAAWKSSNEDVGSALDLGMGMLLCFKMNIQGSTAPASYSPSITWPGTQMAAQSVLDADYAAMKLTIQSIQAACTAAGNGANVFGVCFYQEMDGKKRQTQDGLTDQINQITFLYRYNYARFKTDFPGIDLVIIYTGFTTDNAGREAQWPGPHPLSPGGPDGTGNCYVDSLSIDLYADGWASSGSAARYPWSENPSTKPGYCDIAAYANTVLGGGRQVKFGWTEIGDSAQGNIPPQTAITNYLAAAATDPYNLPGDTMQHGVLATYQKWIKLGYPITPPMWYARASSPPGPNLITDQNDFRIPLWNQVDSATASVTSPSITGNPTQAGVYGGIAFNAADTGGHTASATVSITINGVTAPPSISTPSPLTPGQVGVPQVWALGVNGGTPPFAWSLAAGTAPLPDGLAFTPDGTLSGTPNAAGSYGPKFKVTDAAGKSASAVLALTINPAPVDPGTVAPPLVVGGAVAGKDWHFLFCAPQPDGTVLEEVVQSRQRQLIVRAGPGAGGGISGGGGGVYSEVNLDVNGQSQAALATTGKTLALDVQVRLGAQTLFCGRLGVEADTLSATDTHRFTPQALDYRELLRRRDLAYIDPSVNSGGPPEVTTDIATIAWRLLQPTVYTAAADGKQYFGTQYQPGGNLGIRQGAGASGLGITYTNNYVHQDFVGAAIDRLCQVSPGSDWDISMYGTAGNDLRLDMWSPWRGSDKGVVLEWGGGLVSGISRGTDPSQYANSVFVPDPGTFTGSTWVQEDADDINTRPEGRWDQVYSSSAADQASLQSDADWALAAGQVVLPTYTITLYAGAWPGPDYLWIGDIVTVIINSGRLHVQDRVPVTEMQFDVGPTNVEAVTITAGRVPFRDHQALANVLRRLRRLETM